MTTAFKPFEEIVFDGNGLVAIKVLQGVPNELCDWFLTLAPRLDGVLSPFLVSSWQKGGTTYPESFMGLAHLVRK